MTTLVVSPRELEVGEVEVSGDAYRHLFRASRLAVGDELRVVDGCGRARHGTVAAVGHRAARLRLGGPVASNEPALELELLVAAPRPERAAWLVEKATEVGVVAVRLLRSERSPRSYGAAGFERLRRVAHAAVEQCGRSRLPAVSGVHEWSELDRLLAELPRRWVLDVAAGGEGSDAVRPVAPGAAALLVGPEGGWSDAERRHLAERGCRALGLGPRVLRVETAAVVGAALVLLP